MKLSEVSTRLEFTFQQKDKNKSLGGFNQIGIHY